MNAIVTLDSILEPSQALAPASLFGTGQIETILAAIEGQVKAEVFTIDTEEGRERIKSIAYKIARSKTTLDEIGKEHVAEIKKQSGAVDAERRIIRERLDALKDSVRGPLTAWETAETERVDGHERALVTVLQGHIFESVPTSTHIMDRQAELSRFVERDWQEFRDRASEAYQETFPRLEGMRIAAEQAERDAAELAELRRQKAEREEADRKASHEADVAQAAADAAEREEARAALAEIEKAEAIRKAVEAIRKAVAEAEARADREKAQAIEAERQRLDAIQRRQEQEKAQEAAAAIQKKATEEAAEQKRQENKRHRARVHARIMGALIQLGLGDEQARDLIGKIAAGEVPHLSINY